MRIKGKSKSILTRQRLPVLGLFEGLLDQVSGAAAAYSIRLLRADYSDGLLRVRAFDGSSDQGEADVLPDSNNQISLNSELTNRDSTAGSSGRDVSTLGELVTNSSGTDYDGFVSEWKDQSPNANHAINSTASEQPKIVSAGSLIKDNNKPTLKFENNQNLSTGIISKISQPFSILHVRKDRKLTSAGNEIIDTVGTNAQRIIIDTKSGQFRIFAGSSLLYQSRDTSQHIHYGLLNGASSEANIDKQTLNTGDVGSNGLEIVRFGGGDDQTVFNVQEFAVFDDNKSSSQQDIKDKINNFYGTF